MRMKFSLTIFAALATGLMSTAAIAATTTGTSTTQAPSRILDKLTLSYAGYYLGPSLAHPCAFTPNVDGSLSEDKQVFDSVIYGGYKVNSDLTASVGVPFNYYPVGGQDYLMKDPYLRFMHANLLNRGTLNLAADLRIYLPVTTASDKAGITSAVRSTQYLEYGIPDTRWTIGAATFIRGRTFTAEAQSGKDLELYLSPSVTYKISPTVSAVAGYEMYSNHLLRDGNLFNLSTDTPADYSFGVNWDVSKKLTLNPYISGYTSTQLKAAQFNVFISAKFL
ncbi:MAG TPA: hypothetical protein VJB59_13810 [Bdellovibrionota bacterium]|nr:hypothetical protein [Bdellovibrionota bacterium]